MTKPDDEFLQQLQATFRVEADEHLQTMFAGLLALEQSPAGSPKLPLIESVYREAHSLKGAARAVNRADIEGICQSIESVFASWKRGEQSPSAEALDAVHRSLDHLRGLLTGSARPAEQAAPAGDTIRMATGKLDKLLREAEELLAVKLTTRQRAAELRDITAMLSQERRRLGGLGSDVDHRETVAPFLHALEERLAALTKAAQQDHHDVSRMVDDLLDDSKKLLMLPFSTMLGVLPKLVRDLCRDQGKDAEVILQGAEAEIDKRILEEMKDPLVHLVRNCVDHGLEAPSERARQGKPPRGKISITVTEVEGNKVEIAITDDGTGIDTGKVRDAAVRLGILTAEDARQLDDDAAVMLIFQSEISTSSAVTAISGRGLGLAIVREKVSKLGGQVSVENRPGRGATFRIRLPLTLATFRGILIEAAGQVFVVPTANVAHVARIRPGDIKTVENRETISLNGHALSLARLENVLELARPGKPTEASVAMVLGTADKQIAFAVDAVLNETEVLVKPLHKPLARVRNVAGATILGSGHVLPVLNVADLMKSAVNAPAPPRPVAVVAAKTRKTVLVVEDSITSRMLLKNILESAGYRVRTAVDGVDALTALKTEDFDAVVSDIEMPRLNGFGLTEKIRGDKKLAEMPVVLVTALETAADRERGVDVGANAYIVKSSFDQSNLLEELERLV